MARQRGTVRGGRSAPAVHAGAGPCAVLALALALAPSSAPLLAQEPYRFYGGDVDSSEKSPAVEACEYEELIEKQRCNRSLNKTTCIEGIREECARRALEGEDGEKNDAERRTSPPKPQAYFGAALVTNKLVLGSRASAP